MSTCPAIVKTTGIVCGNPSKFGVYCGIHKRIGEEIQKADDAKQAEKDRIAKRVSECNGDGSCLEQAEKDGRIGIRGYGHCKPVKCPRCNGWEPQYILDCNEGHCMNCAIILYSQKTT